MKTAAAEIAQKLCEENLDNVISIAARRLNGASLFERLYVKKPLISQKKSEGSLEIC